MAILFDLQYNNNMMDAYTKAHKLAEASFRKAVIEGRFPYPPALDEVIGENNALSKERLGVLEIPLSLVIGTRTKGRQNLFSYDFMPLAERNSEFASKWSSLFAYQEAEGISDPVLVYEYLHEFYIQEGNKRVSVMKYLRVPTISAEVIRVLPDEETLNKHPEYRAFLQFYRAAPVYEIAFSHHESYQRLAELLGQTLDEKWDDALVRRLRATYYIFSKIFAKRAAKEAAVSCSDAFLIYLSVYPLESLYQKESEIEARLLRMRREFLITAEADHITLLETPPQKRSSELPFKNVLSVITETKPLRISFLYDHDPQISSKDFEHEVGRIILNHHFKNKIITDKYEHCADTDKLKQALKSSSANSDVIFTTSPLQFHETFRSAHLNPAKKYLNCSAYLPQSAVRTYDIKLYEVKFLLGVLAAVCCENHRIAYIADVPVYGTIADINAFAIGAEMIDPKAEIYLGWISLLDQDWQDQMRTIGISTFSGPEFPVFSNDAAAYGLYQLKETGVVNLAAPVLNWANYYIRLVEDIMNGGWAKEKTDPDKGISYWWGLQAEVVDIRISDSLPYPSRKLLQLLKNAIISGQLNPFDAELRSNTGIIKPALSPRLSNQEILTMDWLNDNVFGSIPASFQLKEDARKITGISGVRK